VSVIPLPLSPVRAVFCQAARTFVGLLVALLVLVPAALFGQTLAFPARKGSANTPPAGATDRCITSPRSLTTAVPARFAWAVGSPNRHHCF